MNAGRIVAGLALAAALGLGACTSQTPTFAEPGLADPPAPRDTTALSVPKPPEL